MKTLTENATPRSAAGAGGEFCGNAQGTSDYTKKSKKINNFTPKSAAPFYVEAGLSVIPTSKEMKAPKVPWKEYQRRKPTEKELLRWNGLWEAIGIVTGAVSGNLEILDFDLQGELYPVFSEIVEREVPGLMGRLVIQKTQNKGFHVAYRCHEIIIPGNTKLAKRAIESPDDNDVVINGKAYKTRKIGNRYIAEITLIETRGEAGQFLADPSPGYKLQQGSFLTLPCITKEERDLLIQTALSLNEWIEPAKVFNGGKDHSGGKKNRPGEDFNQRGDVLPLLLENGWEMEGSTGGIQYLRRPGKDRGRSASLIEGRIFYNYSTNAPPFEANKAYSPFAVYAFLKHDGDFPKAALYLSKEGYGEQRATSKITPTLNYSIADGCLSHTKVVKGVEVTYALCNFSATISAEEIRDDGLETQVFFQLTGTLADGRPLPSARVPANQFSQMNWVVQTWGTRPIVYAGQSIKDNLRVAIQLVSGEVPQITVFGHLGWRKIDGKWLFIHAGGAIGTNGPVEGINVDLDGEMQNYILPPPGSSEKLHHAVQVSLKILTVAPAHITAPLLAATYRAPTCEMLPAESNIFCAGGTGCHKTSLTAVYQSHFGLNFNLESLPANWFSTGNALEKQAFLAKDTLLTVDDFCPSGSQKDILTLYRNADRLIRGNSNKAGKQRMRPDGSLRPTYSPRGVIAATGEDVPPGHSLRARMLVIEMKKGDVDLEKLSKAQKAGAEGLLAQAMAGYIQWLASKTEDLKKSLPLRFEELRSKFRSEEWGHDKTPTLLAHLAIGYEMFLVFALDIGAIDQTRFDELWQDGWQSFLKVGCAQEAHHKSENMASRSLSLLTSALSSGRAHIADVKGGEPEYPTSFGWLQIGNNPENQAYRPQGEKIGWLDGKALLLDPEIAFSTVQRLARDQNSNLPISQRILWKRLHEQGYITQRDKGQLTCKRTVEGVRRRVIHLTDRAYDIFDSQLSERMNGRQVQSDLLKGEI